MRHLDEAQRSERVEGRGTRRGAGRSGGLAGVRLALGAAATALLAVALGAGLIACFDLFHSTAGILSACDLDAQACDDGGPTGEAGPAGTDFCAWSPDMARVNAAHACAWLGACETPMGDNAFGTCMLGALLAYDCAANPSHPARGEAHALWDCLFQVQSCGDVTRCLFPDPLGRCQSAVDFTSCGNLGGDPKNADLRIECREGGVLVGENCALFGQTCAKSSGPTGLAGSCVGASEDAGGLSCATTECVGTHLHQCGASGVDLGIDCASNGAGQCAGFRHPGDTTVDWIACVASGDAGCTPDPTATCAGGYATSCPSGISETINCTELLQPADGGCIDGPLSPQFDWTSACRVDPPQCTGDSCNGTALIGCARGATFTTDCAAQGFQGCTMLTTDAPTGAVHAACTGAPSELLDGGTGDP